MNPVTFLRGWTLALAHAVFGRPRVDDPWAPVDPAAAFAARTGPPEWAAVTASLQTGLVAAIRTWAPPHVTVADHGWRVVAHTPSCAVTWCNSYVPWEHVLAVELHARSASERPWLVATLARVAAARKVPYSERVDGAEPAALAAAVQRSVDTLAVVAPGLFDDPAVIGALATKVGRRPRAG